MTSLKKIGLIVNPVAGLGGRVGLKGSDGPDIQQQARALGATPQAENRAAQALAALLPLADRFELLTCPAEMGENAARLAGLPAAVVGAISPGHTTAADTRAAAQLLREQGVDLLLFAGGDGTARDIYLALGPALPVLGIPAGVKIHSAVYAANPAAAGELAGLVVQGKAPVLQEHEVMDLDEEAVRQGVVAPKLYGYLKVPHQPRLMQSLKHANPAGEQAVLEGIAWHVIDRMLPDRLYILGPGTTTRTVAQALNLPKTLIGVDVLLNKELLAADVNEKQLLALLADHPATIVVTLIGGQGFVFGRGNQQLSPAVIRQVGRENITIISTPAKIYALDGRPLRLDTGDPALDSQLAGYVQIVTGYNHTMVYKIQA